MAEVIEMPKLSDTMEEGVIAKWLVKEGDAVSAGDVLAEVETDKAVMELETFEEGKVLHVAIKDGESAPVGGLIAIIGEEGEDVQKLIDEHKASAGSNGGNKADKEAETKVPAPKEAQESKKESQQESKKEEASKKASKSQESTSNGASPQDADGRIKASPLAKALAKEQGVDLGQLKGTGPGGRVVQRDIEAYLESGAQQEAKPADQAATSTSMPGQAEGYTDVQASQMRKTIAKRLVESKNSAPHFYLTMAIDMEAAVAFRENLKSLTDVKISFNDLIIKAAATALRKHPAVNSSWTGEAMRRYDHVHIGVAVAVDEGLIVPVVRHADAKGLEAIATEVRDLATKARNRQLQPQDYQGNTFSISNLGMYGIEAFTAIINPPDACIMAVGAIVDEAVVKNGKVVPGKTMRVTLSCDHRAVDGATGSEFLQTFKALMENPMRLLL